MCCYLQVQDTDVAKIVEMGFPADQASAALRQAGGKVDEAINNLLGGGDTRPRGRTGIQQQSRPGTYTAVVDFYIKIFK